MVGHGPGEALCWIFHRLGEGRWLFAARRYLEEGIPATPDVERTEILASTPLPNEIKLAFVSPPEPSGSAARRWGEFVDAATAAELEVISYGERPPLLHELRAGLERAAAEAGPETDLGRWFLDRRDALPGTDLPEDLGYLPV